MSSENSTHAALYTCRNNDRIYEHQHDLGLGHLPLPDIATQKLITNPISNSNHP